MALSNFSFLSKINLNAAENLIKAEKYYALFDDTVIVLDLLRRSLLDIINYIIISEQIDVNLKLDLNTKLKELEVNDYIPPEILNLMHEMRKERNKVYYQNKNSQTLYFLMAMFVISKWYYYKYEGLTDYPDEFIDPNLIYSKTEHIAEEKLDIEKEIDNNNYVSNTNALIELQKRSVKINLSNDLINIRHLRSEQIIRHMQPVIKYCEEYFGYIFTDTESFAYNRSKNEKEPIIIEISQEKNNTEAVLSGKTSSKKLMVGIFMLMTFGIFIYAINTHNNQKQMLLMMNELIVNKENNIVMESTKDEETDTDNFNQESDKTMDDGNQSNDAVKNNNDAEKAEVSESKLESGIDTESKNNTDTKVQESFINNQVEVSEPKSDFGVNIESKTNTDMEVKETVINKQSEAIQDYGNYTEKAQSAVTVINGWIYIINDNNKIYKMDTNGGSLVKMSSVNAFNLELYNDWLYFYSMDDEYIYKMDIDGKDIELVTSECYPPNFGNNEVKSFVINNNYLYYLIDSKHINRLNLLNNTEEEIISTDRDIEFFDVESKLIYLVYGVDFAVYNIDNEEGDSLEQAQNWTNIRVYNGFAYYVFADNSISKIKNDGSISASLGRGSNQIVIEGGYIYSVSNSYPAYGHLIKYDINGNNEIVLSKNSTYAIDIDGDWIYYSTSGDFRKIKSNGHNETIINEMQPREIIVKNF